MNRDETLLELVDRVLARYQDEEPADYDVRQLDAQEQFHSIFRGEF